MTSPDRPAVLVTGATGALGSAIVRAFAARGFLVGVHRRSSGERAADLVAEAERLGGAGLALEADLSTGAACASLVERFVEQAARIDVLVNCAGGNSDRLLHFTDEAAWREVLAINLDAVYAVTRAAVAVMLRERRGSIVTISSISGLLGLAGQTAYAAAKAGVHGFTRALAREVGRFGIRVNAVAPGAIESEAVAALAAFLGSDEASFITGQVIAVDGGIV